MNRTLAVAGTAALALAGLAVWFSLARSGPTPEAKAGDPAFPELVAAANDIERIELDGLSNAVRLQRVPAGPGGQPTWIVETSGGYPARFESVKGLLAGLSGLRIDQPMTARPDRFAELGLAWPEPGGRGRLLRLVAADGRAIEIVLGDERANPRTQYVRRLSEDQTWRVRGSVLADLEPNRWFDAELLTLPADETVAVTMEGLVLRRGADGRTWDHALADGAEGWNDPSIASAKSVLPSFLTRLEFDDVRPLPGGLGDVDWIGVERELAFETVRGTVRLGLREGDEGLWLRLDARPVPGAPSADDINARRKYPGDPFVPDWDSFRAKVAPWEFLLPEWKANALRRAKDPARAELRSGPGEFVLPSGLLEDDLEADPLDPE